MPEVKRRRGCQKGQASRIGWRTLRRQRQRQRQRQQCGHHRDDQHMVQYARRKQCCRGCAQGRHEGHRKQRKSCCESAARSGCCDGVSRLPEPNGAAEGEQQPRIEMRLCPQLRWTRGGPQYADMATGIEFRSGSTRRQEQWTFPFAVSCTALRRFWWRPKTGSAPQKIATAQLPQTRLARRMSRAKGPG